MKRINLTSWKPRRGFWKCIESSLNTLNTSGITVVFVSLDYMKNLKRDMFGQEVGADVLTFVYNGFKEVVVCPEFLNFEEVEVAWRIIHGTLHALGYDHKVKSKAEEMENLEGKILQRFKDCFLKATL